MRRLWSYIILGLTAIVLMGAGFTNVFTKVNGNIDYKEGRELVFRISDKDDVELTDDTAVKEIADTMISRLEAQDVTQYRVSTQGLDTITVELEQDTTSNYNNIQTLLTFNGTLALTSKLDDSILQDEFRTDDKTYTTTENDLPVIYIPVGKDINKIYEIVKGYKDDSKTEAAEETKGEGEDAESTYAYYIYLWHDYDPDFDLFAKTQSGDQYDEHVAKKIFMRFNVQDIQDMITVDGEEGTINYLKTYVNITDLNKNSKYEANEVRHAYDNAKFYVNLLNASQLDYDVTFLYDNIIPAWTDELVNVSGNIMWSHTLIATVCAIAFFALILAFFYRLGALSVVTMTLASVFASLGMIVLFSAEFNVATLVGFIVVAIVSMVSGVIYNTKFKEECYRGRSLKKANSEGAKKALLPIVDIHVAVIAIGVFSYLFSGIMMRGFAAVTVLGGLISLLLNILGLRGMMWLATNATKLQGRYEVFGVEQDKVPDVIKEEKQQYFGRYENKNFTKKAKPVGIIAGLCLIAGVAGLVAFANMKGGVIYNNGTTTQNSEIYVETDTKNTVVKLVAVEDSLKNTYVYKGTDEANAKALSTYVAVDADKAMKIEYQTRTDTNAETKEEITYTYYIIDLKSSEVFGSDYHAYYTYKLDDETMSPKVYDTDGVANLLQKYFEEVVGDDATTVSIKGSKIVSSYSPNFLSVFWGTLMGSIISGLYLLLRYRLSRGIVALVAPVAVASTVAGIIALTTLPVTSAAAYCLPFVAIFTSILSIIFMNKERELVIEDKAHDRSIDNRKAIMERATSLAAYPMIIATFLATYLCLDFFGFGAANNAWLFLIFIIGGAVSLGLTLVLFGPISQFFYKLFFKVDTEKVTSRFHRKKKVKKNQSPRNKSAEPEEYTFIGIND